MQFMMIVRRFLKLQSCEVKGSVGMEHHIKMNRKLPLSEGRKKVFNLLFCIAFGTNICKKYAIGILN